MDASGDLQNSFSYIRYGMAAEILFSQGPACACLLSGSCIGAYVTAFGAPMKPRNETHVLVEK